MGLPPDIGRFPRETTYRLTLAVSQGKRPGRDAPRIRTAVRCPPLRGGRTHPTTLPVL